MVTRISQVTLFSLWFLLIACLFFQNIGEAGPSVIPQAKIESRSSVHFVALGDTGSGVSFQTDVAQQMNRLYEKTPFSIVLMLGDLVYPDGEWETLGTRLYKKVYAPLMQKGVRFRPALGNHDVRYGYRKGTIEYYKMPHRFYAFSQGNVDFFALDTNIMDKHQLQWLDNALSHSTAQWKVVYAHHPLYSSGEHRSNRPLIKQLEPLFTQHHVDFYLAGHDHDYERFRPIKGTVHIVSGGGGAYLREFKKTEAYSFRRLKKHHFIHFYILENQAHLQVIDKTGQVIDSETYLK